MQEQGHRNCTLIHPAICANIAEARHNMQDEGHPKCALTHPRIRPMIEAGNNAAVGEKGKAAGKVSGG